MPAPDMSQLLEIVIRENASDLHLAVGRPPAVRIRGDIHDLGNYTLTPDDTMALMKSITPDRCQQELQEAGGADFGFAYGEKARFRVAIFKQKGCIGLVLRLIPSKLLTFEEIGLPPIIKDVCRKPRGLVLVTGPTGSGKTTTLATMIDFINAEDAGHILTVEDPIEYYHKHKKCVITQREVGADVPTFSEALRRALRADPDVILVGEMRDLETIRAAITAAETGHLVFATLHTTGSANTINRIIDAFPADQQEQIRTQLATSLESVISQTLMKTANGKGRIAAFEILFLNDAVRNLIRENKIFRINSVIQTNRKLGMVLMDDCLFEYWVAGKIAFREMMMSSQDPQALHQKIRDYTEQMEHKKK